MRLVKRYGFGAAGMLALVITILLVTGWGSAVAAQIQSVFVTNGPANPVSVHEEGTATISGTVGLAPTGNTVQVGNIPSVKLDASGNTVQLASGTSVGIAGTPNVNVGNFPSTEQVSGAVSSSDVTTVLGENETPGQVNNNQNSADLIGPVDTSKAREVRLSIECFGTSACANVEVDVYTTSGVSYQLDSFTMGSPSSTRTYEIPGRNLSVLAFHTDTNMLISTVVLGRSN